MEATIATFTQFHRDMRRFMIVVTEQGGNVILTNHGRPVAMMVPYQPVTVIKSLDEIRDTVVTDESILDAIRSAREDSPHFAVEP